MKNNTKEGNFVRFIVLLNFKVKEIYVKKITLEKEYENLIRFQHETEHPISAFVDLKEAKKEVRRVKKISKNWIYNCNRDNC